MTIYETLYECAKAGIVISFCLFWICVVAKLIRKAWRFLDEHREW